MTVTLPVLSDCASMTWPTISPVHWPLDEAP
jgi:hypothetical protein